MSDDALARFDALYNQILAAQDASEPFFEVFRQHTGKAFIKEFFIKPARLVMQEVSESYDRDILGGRRELYVGKTDIEYWGYETGSLFFENDMRVINGLPFPDGSLDEYGRLSEPWVSPTTGAKGVWNGRKYRLDVGDRVFLVGLD